MIADPAGSEPENSQIVSSLHFIILTKGHHIYLSMYIIYSTLSVLLCRMSSVSTLYIGYKKYIWIHLTKKGKKLEKDSLWNR